MAYTIILVVASLSPYLLGYTGLLYGVAATILGGIFLYGAIWTLFDKQDAAGRSLTKDRPAKWTFKYSLLYLFLLFFALALDHLVY